MTNIAGAAQSDGYGIQAVARALAVLETFTERRPELTTTEIGELAGLNRATAYRFCHTLLQLAYLEEVEPGRFRPGRRAVALTQAALASRRLPTVALPALRELRAATGAIVNLALLDEHEIVYVVRLLNDELPALRLFVGSRLPAARTSLGRAMLAWLPRAELRGLLDRAARDDGALAAELERTRTRGFALNDEALVPGAYGVGAPVLDADERPLAAVNVSLFRRPAAQDVEQRLAPAVIATSEAIAALARHHKERLTACKSN